jgi:hypothetical protein
MKEMETHPVNIGRVENDHVPINGVLVGIIKVPCS